MPRARRSRRRRASRPIDVLVNNAGMGMLARFEDVTDLSQYERLMRVNYLGSVYPTFYALPHLKRSRGQIVAISSLAGLCGVPHRSAYAATKHAQIGFFDSLRIELRETGVSVTVIAPYFVQSEIRRRSPGPDGRTVAASPIREAEIMSAEECARRIVARDGEAPAHPGDDAQGQARPLGRARVSGARRPPRRGSGPQGALSRYSTITRSLAPRPNVSGLYISSALGGGTTKVPGVVARAT